MPNLAPSPFGHALRHWRTARHLSQLELAMRAQTPPRHVSFLETGRSRPSQEMVLRLAEALDVPLHERNGLLLAAGFAPRFHERPLADDALGSIRFVIERMLAAHAPYPGIVLDRWYDILGANVTAERLLLGGAKIDPDDPPSLVDLLLGPMRPAVLNWDELVFDMLWRLRREVAAAVDDARLAGVLERVEAASRTASPPRREGGESPVLFTRVRFGDTELRTLSTLVYFGGARDVTVDGLHMELIFPADAATEAVFRAAAADPRAHA